MTQWQLEIENKAVQTAFSQQDDGNPIDKVLTFSLDLGDPDNLTPFFVRLQKIETETGEVLKTIKIKLTPIEFTLMTSRLSQLQSIYRMVQQTLEPGV